MYTINPHSIKFSHISKVTISANIAERNLKIGALPKYNTVYNNVAEVLGLGLGASVQRSANKSICHPVSTSFGEHVVLVITLNIKSNLKTEPVVFPATISYRGGEQSSMREVLLPCLE